jgi:hypothetical protein
MVILPNFTFQLNLKLNFGWCITAILSQQFQTKYFKAVTHPTINFELPKLNPEILTVLLDVQFYDDLRSIL